MVRKLVIGPFLAGVIGLALVVSACGSSSKSSSSAAAAPSTATAASSGGSASSSGSSSAGINVGVGKIKPSTSKNIAVFDQSSPAYTYGVALANGAKQEAAKLGYHIDLHYDNLNAQTELSGFQQAISSGKYSGILIEPFNTQLCVPIRTEALKYHVLVIVVGTPLCDKGPGAGKALWAPGTISYVGGQNNVPGINQVLAAAAKLQKGPQKVGFIFGPNGYASDVAWQVAFKAFQKTHPDWTLEAQSFGDFTTPTSFQLAQNMLSGHHDLTVLFDPYVDATVGVVKAVQASGRASSVAVYDNGGGSKVSAQLVKKGELKGDLPVYPESLGSTGIKLLVGALHGKAPARFVDGDGNPNADKNGVITQANVNSFTPQW